MTRIPIAILLALLVPAGYALCLILAVGLPLSLFTGGVSAAVLQGILGYLQLLDHSADERQRRYLDRALLLADRMTRRQAAMAGGLVWEHYRRDWSVDTDFNRELGVCEYSVITHDDLTPGIFSKIAGVMPCAARSDL